MEKITKEQLLRWFKDFNKKCFYSEIKTAPTIKLSKTRTSYGQCCLLTGEIRISTAFIRSERDYINTLLHEMCHLYVYEKYGANVQSHGYEWKEIADRVTKLTNGKYGTIQRVGGGLDKSVLKGSGKMEKYIVFTDHHGHFSIAKYSSDEFVKRMMEYDFIKENTRIYYFTSDNDELDKVHRSRVNKRSLSWEDSEWDIDELMKMSHLVSTTIYSKTHCAA